MGSILVAMISTVLPGMFIYPASLRSGESKTTTQTAAGGAAAPGAPPSSLFVSRLGCSPLELETTAASSHARAAFHTQRRCCEAG